MNNPIYTITNPIITINNPLFTINNPIITKINSIYTINNPIITINKPTCIHKINNYTVSQCKLANYIYKSTCSHAHKQIFCYAQGFKRNYFTFLLKRG